MVLVNVPLQDGKFDLHVTTETDEICFQCLKESHFDFWFQDSDENQNVGDFCFGGYVKLKFCSIYGEKHEITKLKKNENDPYPKQYVIFSL